MRVRSAIARTCGALSLLVVLGPALAADARLAGIWLPDSSRSQRMPPDPPYTAEGRRIVEEWRATHDPVEDDPGAFCQAPGMPSLALGGADYPVEIIVRPEQITILMELHQQNRRIYMNLEEHPARPFPQRNGHSIGEWDGDTLVVDTNAIRAITFGAVPHSDQVRVTERWNVIDDGGALVNEITVVDPVIYAEPIVIRQYYKRAVAGTRMLEYECTEGMWEDHERERERRQREAQQARGSPP